MNPTIRAYRFAAAGISYAIDIKADAVLFLELGPQGWERVEAFAPVTATDANILAQGGHVRFIDLILEAINAALRIIQGKPREGDIPKPEDPKPQDLALQHLNANVITHTLMDGTVQLRVR